MPTVALPPRKPLLIYDGDCGFCIFWITRWRKKVEGRLELQPYHEASVRFPELPVEGFRRAAHLVEPDGRVSAGAEAILRARALGISGGGGGGGWLWVYESVPGARALFDLGYRFVARNRPGLYKVTRLTFGEEAVRRPLRSGTGAPRGPLALAAVVLAAGALLLWLRRPRSWSDS